MTARGEIRVGLSGWNYANWKDSFYKGVKRKDWLSYAASRFSTIEINGTFYREQKPETLAKWREETPAGFVFALKGHRYITHSLHLTHAEESLVRQRENNRPLKERLAVVLWQLPTGQRAVPNRLREFLRALNKRWRKVAHAIEFRHDSWFTDETLALLAEHGVANCISDAGRFPRWDAVSADLVYVRLHGRPHTYASAYGPEGLRPWAGRIADWRADGHDVLVYFDNDAECAAFRDAAILRDMTAD